MSPLQAEQHNSGGSQRGINNSCSVSISLPDHGATEEVEVGEIVIKGGSVGEGKIVKKEEVFCCSVSEFPEVQ